MNGQTTYEIVGVFHDRDELEKAMDALEGKGIDRAQLSLLGTQEAVESQARPADARGAEQARAGGRGCTAPGADQARRDRQHHRDDGRHSDLYRGGAGGRCHGSFRRCAGRGGGGGTRRGIGGGAIGATAARIFNESVDQILRRAAPRGRHPAVRDPEASGRGGRRPSRCSPSTRPGTSRRTSLPAEACARETIRATARSSSKKRRWQAPAPDR